LRRQIVDYHEILEQADGKEKAAAKLRQTIKDVFADFKIAGFGAEVQLQKEVYKSTEQ
jgi:uncharacterized protein (UPF0335 family)